MNLITVEVMILVAVALGFVGGFLLRPRKTLNQVRELPPMPSIHRQPRTAALQPGSRFGRLTAMFDSGARNKHSVQLWVFRCDCGIVKTLSKFAVLYKNTRSCGCLRTEHYQRMREGKLTSRLPVGQ